MLRAVYPGSFDPVTFGHLDIITRSAKLVDELIVGVLVNNAKTPLFSVEERVKILEKTVENLPNVKVIPFEGLLVDFARKMKAQDDRAGTAGDHGFRVRTPDGADQPQAGAGGRDDLSDHQPGILLSEFSSTVKEVAAFGGDISQFVPHIVIERMQEKMDERRRV